MKEIKFVTIKDLIIERRRKHAIHHSTSGNLDRRGIGDIDTLTVHEYLARSRRDRLRYRIYRHPLVMFGLGPAYLFILEHRLPVGLMRSGWMPWFSTMSTNVAIATLVATMMWLVSISCGGPMVQIGATGRSSTLIRSDVRYPRS